MGMPIFIPKTSPDYDPNQAVEGRAEIDMSQARSFTVEITDADYPLVNLDFTCEEIAKELAEALDELIRDIYNEGARINKKSGEAMNEVLQEKWVGLINSGHGNEPTQFCIKADDTDFCFSSPFSQRNIRARCRLISAAPDLAKALLPFAGLLQSHNDQGPDNQPIFGINDTTITLGDLRKAVAALKKAGVEL